MKKRTIILILILFALILAVFLFPRRSASDQEAADVVVEHEEVIEIEDNQSVGGL